ncbi:hypothetical protein ACI65C_013776 [Semiaphis heraclei]
MESALRDLKSEKFSLGEAARAHGIPYTTLRQYALKQGISVKAPAQKSPQDDFAGGLKKLADKPLASTSTLPKKKVSYEANPAKLRDSWQSPSSLKLPSPANSPSSVKMPSPAKSPSSLKLPSPANSPSSVKMHSPAKSPSSVKSPSPAKSPSSVKSPSPAKSPSSVKSPPPAKCSSPDKRSSPAMLSSPDKASSPTVKSPEELTMIKTIEKPFKHINRSTIVGNPRSASPRYSPISEYAIVARSPVGRETTLSPVARSPIIYPNSPLRIDGVVDEVTTPRRRLNVIEKNLNEISHRLIKYCPICSYQTDDNKLSRHVSIKHKKYLRKPVETSIKRIGEILGSSSRRSISIVPMTVIKKQLGPYWDDVPMRKIAFQLCIMGRMKVYGGSWDLPEAPQIESPFKDYLVEPRLSPARTVAKPVVTEEPLLDIPEERPLATPGKQFRKALEDSGFQEQLPQDHTLIRMHKASLKLSHGRDSMAVKNYIANVAKILSYVKKMVGGQKLTNWTLVRLARDKREELGQTVATSINYLKNLNVVFEMAISTYCYEDTTFEKNKDLGPCPIAVNRIRVVRQKLNLVYKQKLKLQPQELFTRKTVEADQLPEYGKIMVAMDSID